MKLNKKDKAFRTNKISHIDYKYIEMDRVLTNLFARLKHNGAPSKLKAKPMSLALYKEEFLDPKNEGWFNNFGQAPSTVERWVETHLVDLVNRGKSNEVVACPRPLHGNTYLFRNPKHCRDYGVSQQVYELLYHAHGTQAQAAINGLKRFFFEGVDTTTGQYDSQSTVDVETQALLRLSDQVKSDAPDNSAMTERHKPLIQDAANIFAEDIIRLLTYKQYIPRTVMVDYLKVLMAFHLGLYQLRLLKLLPALLKSKGGQADDKDKSRIGVYVDVTGGRNDDSVALAEASAALQYKRIPGFIKAYFSVKKLDEFAEYLSKKGKISGSKSVAKMPVEELLQTLLDAPLAGEREMFFGQRNGAILDSSVSSAHDKEDIPPEIHAMAKLGLSEFETYIEILLYVQGNAIRTGMVKNIDSLLLKNKTGALLQQARGKAERGFVLDSRLLEVLLQLAVLKPGGNLGFHTGELRIDELLGTLSERYGIHIDSLPKIDNFAEESINVRKTLRENLVGFKQRLREIGFYKDLSDAYISQTISPRYEIEKSQVKKQDKEVR